MKNKKTIKVTRLRAERLKRKLTLKEVAEAIGATFTTIKSYELLQRTPSLQKYRQLEELYGTNGEDLLEVIEIDGENVFHSIKSL